MHLLLPPRGLWGYTLIVASRRGTSLCRHNAASSPLAFAKAFSLIPATSLAKPDWTPRGTGYEGRRKEKKWPHGWAQTYRGRCALPLEGRRFLHSLRGGECAGHFGGKGDDKDKREACLELSGLTCGACVAKVERALLSVDGVVEVRVSSCVLFPDLATSVNGQLYDRWRYRYRYSSTYTMMRNSIHTGALFVYLRGRSGIDVSTVRRITRRFA